ncbi:hypothetical protein [Pseudodesulfovibrio karagichevae]|uniref:Uncharacterized protein n=1 Tax=Pseudodesulfovibrio karagichevae TaxID=3239305 RepID=A0ABV4K230_9BACT
MSDDITLSERDLDAAMSSEYMKVPPKTGIFRGARFSLSTKVGGRMQLVQVVCKGEPYERTLGKGKKALYVEVYGYGVRKAVNVKKLQEVQRG